MKIFVLVVSFISSLFNLKTAITASPTPFPTNLASAIPSPTVLPTPTILPKKIVISTPTPTPKPIASPYTPTACFENCSREKIPAEIILAGYDFTNTSAAIKVVIHQITPCVNDNIKVELKTTGEIPVFENRTKGLIYKDTKTKEVSFTNLNPGSYCALVNYCDNKMAGHFCVDTVANKTITIPVDLP